MANRMKDDDKNEKIIRGLLKLPANRRCINCKSLGPQYVCTNFWTFICTNCSGLHREFTHRVKSISMAKFTSQEVNALEEGGNERAMEIYFKEWDPQRHSYPDSSNLDRLRDFIKHVYVDRRYSGGRNAEGPPRVKGVRDDYDENRRPDSYRSGSQSPSYDEAYERRFGEQPSSAGKSDDRNIRLNYDARSPGYDQDDYRSPSRFEVRDETRRDDKGGNEIQFPKSDNRIQEGLPKTGVSDHQKGVYISSPPMVRPVRDILGSNVPPLQVGEPPKLCSPKTLNNPLDTQVPTSSSTGSNEGNSVKLKRVNSGSLIDFSADPESPVSSSTQASSAQPTASIPGNIGGGWASFDVSNQQIAPEAASSKRDLESVFSQLSVQAPASGVNPATSPMVSIDSFPKVNNNEQWATENQLLSSLPVGSTQSSIRPVNTLVGSLNQQINSRPAGPFKTTTHGPVAILDGLHSHAAMHPSHAIAAIGNSQNALEAKPPGRKELPADLFTGLYPTSLSYGGWRMGPRQGMVYGMHYPVMAGVHGAAQQPVMAFRGSSISTNPFDTIQDSTLAHNPMLPSMASFQRSQPPMNNPPSIPPSSKLGAFPSQWIPPQQFSYQSSASPDPYMMQQFPRNMPQQLPSSSFLTMNQGVVVGNESSPYSIPAGSQHPAAPSSQLGSHNSVVPSVSGNPFG